MPRLKRLDTTQGDPKARELMADLESKKLLLNIYRGMANSPAVLDGYLKFAGAIKEGKLDARTRSAIALAVAQANRCDYCLSANAAIGRTQGLDDASIEEARRGRSSDAKTQAAITLATRLVKSHGAVTDADVLGARAAGLDDGEIAEVVANVAINLFTNYFNHLNQTEVDFAKLPVDLP